MKSNKQMKVLRSMKNNRQMKVLRFLSGLGLVVAMALTGEAAEQPGGDSGKNLAQILGHTEDWQLSAGGNATIPEPVAEEGKLRLTATNGVLTLTSSRPLAAGTDIEVACRLAPPSQGNRYLDVRFASTNPATANSGTSIRLSVRAGQSALEWGFWDPLAPPDAGYAGYIGGNYNPQGVGERSLTWPENFRARVEHEMAQTAPLAEKRLHIRLSLLPDGFRVWLEGRLLAERRRSGFSADGFVQLSMSAGGDLFAAAIAPGEADDPRFERIVLDRYLNAGALNGSPVRRESLPEAGRDAQIGGIPFRFPSADERGNTHLDIGASWLQCGNLSGYFGAHDGSFGGRWGGALSVNPARVQFRVRNGRYQAVHVIAAADDDPDEVPILTAQFYRQGCGFPRQFAARVPLFSARATDVAVVPLKLANGKDGRAWLVTIPVEPGALAEYDDLDHLEMELTKEAQLYRAYPDPLFYSYHPAGQASSVHVFAMTLERPAVAMRVTPRAFADAWAAPDRPAYDVTLRNAGDNERRVSVTFKTVSHDGEETTTTETSETILKGRSEIALAFAPAVRRHGYHDVEVALTDGAATWHERRGMAWLHPDTRERGDWQEGRGSIFGFWNWRGGHRTPSGAQQVDLMGLAGAESSSGSFEQKPVVTEAEKEAARKWKMVTFKAFGAGDHYITAAFAEKLAKEGLEAARTNFLKDLAESKTAATDINRPEICSFFPEPHLGPNTYGTPPDYYGDPELPLTEQEMVKYKLFHDGFVQGARILKEAYPGVRCLLPHGDPLFASVLLRRSEEVRKLIDGTTIDIPVFERIPEHQIHQVSIHRMYMCREEYRKAGIPKPLLPMYEGPSLSSMDGALTEQQLADHSVRASLILIGYGVERQCGGWAPFDSGSWWGEQHYGGGICHRLPRATPKPAYAAFGAMTRHLNRRNFTRWIPTGSLSVYAMEFVHYKTGEKMHAFWTVRGKRPISVPVAGDVKIAVYDQMDNAAETKVADGTATFAVSPSPCWVYGLTGDEPIALGEPDHGDAAPGPHARKVAGLGDGAWALSTEPDPDYAESQAEFVKRFPGRMSAAATNAPAQAGGKALSVHLDERQERDQKLMPYYATLTPRSPVALPGKGSHLGLWVKAASDWGRVVYALRDAQGERWLSVGSKGAWNCDDMLNWSAFCFDGWRYLRFELPAHSPYDLFREAGTTWWGSYGQGDGVVDLPLTLEKIIVERRTHAMYVNDPQPASNEDVLLGDLWVEYARAEDASDEAVRLSRLRMPVPEKAPELVNPIAALAAAGTGASPQVTRIEPPLQQADGTQCHVHFDAVADAKSYDVWVSPYPDGRGAMKLGANWTAPGGLIRGLRPDTDFYIFLVATIADGGTAKPSPGYQFRLKDMFGMK
jgi:hypothetical protein